MSPPSPRHYFDWAATAIPDSSGPRRVSPEDPGTDTAFGNPSSLHREGRKARESLEEARSRCAGVLGVPEKNLYFSSGGTESNAIVIHSFLLRQGKGQILCGAAEHPSVRENCVILERLGRETGIIPVGPDGRINGETLGRALEKYPSPRLAAIMGVNNEVGSINDIAALSAILRRREGPRVHIHCDLVQAAGKIPLNLGAWDIDSASLSAHKLGGPRGIGLLYLRRPLSPVYTGGGQEGGIRPGTENTAGALALARCLEDHVRREKQEGAFKPARDRFKRLITGLRETGRCVTIPEDRSPEDPRFSPWILQAAFSGIPGEVMVRALDQAGFAVSTGSACSSSEKERPVLAAMGLDRKRSLEGIRISQGWSTTGEEIDLLLEAVREALKFL
ncbi:MAG: cysteine desulfurase [Treponema sp.]|nr:cysteine desulfurase [Treponema sp.]